MSGKHTRNLRSMGRRRFVKTLSGLGVSAYTLKYASQEALAKQADDVDNEVPYIRALVKTDSDKIEREPVYGTIARDKWNRINTAENASQRLLEKLSKKFDAQHIAVGVSPPSVGKHNSWNITVSRRVNEKSGTGAESIQSAKGPSFSLDQLKDEVPAETSGKVELEQVSEHVEGIQVEVRDEIRREQYYDGEYRPVPGGCDINSGTTGFRASEGSTGNFVMVTAGHVLNSINEDSSGKVYQPSGLLINGDHVGNVGSSQYGDDGQEAIWRQDDSSDVTDFGYYEIANGYGVTDKLASDSEGEYTNQVDGIVTWDWIKNEGYASDVYRQGSETGKKVGSIVNHENGRGQKSFWNSANSERGDSGGVHYAKVDGDTCVVGCHAWGVEVDGETQSGGNSAEKIEEKGHVYIY